MELRPLELEIGIAPADTDLDSGLNIVSIEADTSSPATLRQLANTHLSKNTCCAVIVNTPLGAFIVDDEQVLPFGNQMSGAILALMHVSE